LIYFLVSVQINKYYLEAGRKRRGTDPRIHIPVVRIRDVYPGSDFFPSRIPDPNCLHPGSRILIKEFKYFNPRKSKKKWFLSSKKYDPGCSSRIPDPDADFLPSQIPDPGVKKVPNSGSRIRIRNTAIFRNKVTLSVSQVPYN
jgi:hypothetical protein